ncbi:MAG: M15 family metallopeptidase [Actinomycetota bacterium]
MPGPPGVGPERFLLPCYTQPADEATSRAGLVLGPQPALPAMQDPVYPPVLRPSSEPLVPLAHRRIRVLSNYWHAGWDAALPTTWLRAEAFDRLSHAAEQLPDRLGLAIFDAWRPLTLQAELYDAAYHEPGLPDGFVAEPTPDVTAPPPHLTGGTVDLTLTLDGTPLALGTGFDDFTAAAFTESLEQVPGSSRELRRLLYHAMRGAGFVVLHCEWWHFEFGTRRWAAITGNEPLYGPAKLPDR